MYHNYILRIQDLIVVEVGVQDVVVQKVKQLVIHGIMNSKTWRKLKEQEELNVDSANVEMMEMDNYTQIVMMYLDHIRPERKVALPSFINVMTLTVAIQVSDIFAFSNI